MLNVPLQFMAKKKLSVAIVDDNMSFVRRMMCLLKESDDISTIYTANNYNEALAMLDKKPDLVLLDIQLPGKNGMDILKRVKELSDDCDVIMLTNYVGDYYRRKCKKLGALFFLDKTNEFDLVPGKIKELARIKN